MFINPFITTQRYAHLGRNPLVCQVCFDDGWNTGTFVEGLGSQSLRMSGLFR